MKHEELNKIVEKISKDFKILVADDSALVRKIIKKYLENNGFNVIDAKDGKEAWEKFKKFKDEIGVVVLDWIMPELDGLEVCRLIRNLDLDRYVYIIFLSSVEDRDKVAICFEHGADDYIFKPVNQKEFLARVKAGLRIIALEKLLIEANEKLEKLAIIDELTQVLNRRGLFEELKKLVNYMSRAKKDIYFIMIDIDHFKKINDTYGHQVGDLVLKEVVKRLKTNLRSYDIIGRYGGEEFLVALTDGNDKVAYKVAEKLRKIIEEKPIKVNDNLELKVTISVGVSALRAEDLPNIPTNEIIEEKIKNAIKLADEALYKAKKEGRNKVVAANLNI